MAQLRRGNLTPDGRQKTRSRDITKDFCISALQVANMFPLGHIGITLGGAFVLVRASRKSLDPRTFITIVGVASVLPDLIDKPLGLIYGYQGGGRLIGHTLLLCICIMVICLVGWRLARQRMLSNPQMPLLFAFGVWAHLLLDLMWEDPEILLWPSYGLGFPAGEFSWGHLTESPIAIAGEVVGAIVIIYVALLLLMGKFDFGQSDRETDT